MTAGCADKPREITPLDLAYLRGLYRTNTSASFALQKAHVVDQMTRALTGR
jgi:hypothetical protein